MKIFSVIILWSVLQFAPWASAAEAERLPNRQLKAITDAYTRAFMRLDPYYAPSFDLEEGLAEFGDFPSEAYFRRYEKLMRKTERELKAIKVESLNAEDRLSYEILQTNLEENLRDLAFPNRFLDFSQMSNRALSYLKSANASLTNFPFDTVAHYDAYLARAKGFPRYVDQQIRQFHAAIRAKITLSCALVPNVPPAWSEALSEDVEKNPFYQPVQFMPKTFPEAERQRLTRAFAAMVRERIAPSYRKLDKFYKTEYVSHCREAFGIYNLPRAKAWYRALIQTGTGVDMDPAEIHAMGVREVARIAEEMNRLKDKMGFKGSLRAYLDHMRDDPKSYFTNAKDMFDAFVSTKEKTAAIIGTYFNVRPKADFKIVETANAEDAAGTYSDPTDFVPYGRFIVNTKNLRSVPIYDVNSLMLHETVPGHHFQLALQFEAREKLSTFRRKIFSSNAFIEGWAHYCEYLGNEMHMYDDPMQKLGHLNDAMLRAIRLVVDTGIHDQGWTQARAQAYMSEYLSFDPGDIKNEVNRYAAMPGQALGYKIGQQKISDLRAKALARLGSRFDLKGFHDVVLGSGTIPLTSLERLVNNWIEAQTKRATPEAG